MIAQVHISASFNDSLNYLMNRKKESSQDSVGSATCKTAIPVAGNSEISDAHEQSKKPHRQTYQPSLFDDNPVAEDESHNLGKKIEETINNPITVKTVVQDPFGEKAPAYADGARYRILGGNLGGQTVKELTKEAEAVIELRPDIEKPVVGISLSAPVGEKIPAETFREIGKEIVERLELEDSPWVMVQHRDRPHDHAHFVASTVNVNGEKVNMWQCKQRVEEVLREVEIKYDLTRVTSSRETLRAAPKRNETAMLEKEGRKSIKLTLQDHVDAALHSAPDVAGFIEILKAREVRVIPFFEKQHDVKKIPEPKALELRGADTLKPDKVVGVCFVIGDEIMKGSNLGRGFSWNGLQARGLDYQPARDAQLLREVKIENETYLENRKAAATLSSDRKAALIEPLTIANKAEIVFTAPDTQQSVTDQVQRVSVPSTTEKAIQNLSVENAFEPLNNQKPHADYFNEEKIDSTRRETLQTDADPVIVDDGYDDLISDPRRINENNRQFIVTPSPTNSFEIDKGSAKLVADVVTTPPISEETKLADDEPLPTNPASDLYAPMVMELSSDKSTEPEKLPEIKFETQWQPTAAHDDDYFDDWYYLEYEKLIRAQIDETNQLFQVELAKEQEAKQQQEAAVNNQQSVDRILQNFEQFTETALVAQTDNLAQMQKSELLPAYQFSSSADYLAASLENTALPSDAEIHERLSLAVGIEPESECEELTAEECRSDEKENTSRQNKEQSLTRERDAEESVQSEGKVRMQGQIRVLEFGFGD